MRNIVFLGTTGSGKSSTCNTIMNEVIGDSKAYFEVGEEVNSCTRILQNETLPRIGIQLIDTPGFGDTRLGERQIDLIIKELTGKVSNPRHDITGMIDCICLVLRLTPRAQTFKSDLDHLSNLFGTISFKSLIILLIDEKKRPAEQLLKDMCNPELETIKILQAGCKKDHLADWFLCWDNERHRPGQLDELLKRARAVEPYTNAKFIEAQKEIQQRIDDRASAQLKEYKERLEREHKDNTAKIEEEFEKEKAKIEIERNELKAAHKRAELQQNQEIQMLTDQLTELEGISERERVRHEKQLEEMKEEMAKYEKMDREGIVGGYKLALEQSNLNQKHMTDMFNAFIEVNRKETNDLRERIRVAESRPTGGGGGGCTLI